MTFLIGLYKALSIAVPFQSLVTPVIRLILSILLLKVVASRGGYQYLDTVALSIAFSSVFSLFSLPGMLRVRTYLAVEMENRGVSSWRIVPPHAVFAFVASLFFGAFGAFIFYASNILNDKGEFIVFISVLIFAALSSSLVAVEHICGRIQRQVYLRRAELFVFFVFALISIVFNSAVMAACAMHASTAAARYVVLFKGLSSGIKRLDWVSGEHFFSRKNVFYWLSGPGFYPLAANFLQVFSSIAVYSWVMHVLPTGVVGQVAIAYRLAGPIQIISGQLSYSTWGALSAARSAKILGGIGVFTVVVSVLSPFFFTNILKIAAPVDGVLYSVLACVHLVFQGVCQVKGAELYTKGLLKPIFFSAIPHGIAAVFALLLISCGVLDSLDQIMLVLLMPTLCELIVLVIYPHFCEYISRRQQHEKG